MYECFDKVHIYSMTNGKNSLVICTFNTFISKSYGRDSIRGVVQFMRCPHSLVALKHKV